MVILRGDANFREVLTSRECYVGHDGPSGRLWALAAACPLLAYPLLSNDYHLGAGVRFYGCDVSFKCISWGIFSPLRDRRSLEARAGPGLLSFVGAVCRRIGGADLRRRGRTGRATSGGHAPVNEP